MSYDESLMLNAVNNSQTAIFTQDGTATQLVIAGVTYTGDAYSYADYPAAAAGKTVLAFEVLPASVSAAKLSVAEGYTYAFGGGSFSGLTSGAIATAGALTIENSSFTGNSSAGKGAAIDIAKGSVIIQSTVFDGNSASEGGALRLFAGTAEVSGVLFTNNTATANYGGAIVQYGGVLRVGGSTFSGNTGSQGSAISLIGGTVILTDTITLAASDQLRKHGGSYTIDYSLFSDVPYYKIIDAATTASQWNTVGLTGNEDFTLQTVAEDLYIKSTDTAKYDFTTAILSAGGTVSSAVIDGKTVSGVAYDFSDYALATTWGATRYVFVDQTLTGRVVTVANKEYDYTGLQASGIVSASEGGAIYVINTGTAVIENSSFAGNTSSARGGAVYVYLNAKTTIHGTTFTGNLGTDGGAVCNRRDLVIGDVVFDGNSASGKGGAIYSLVNSSPGGSVTIDGKITLMQTSDTIIADDQSVWTINVAAFGDGPYYQVIDAVAAANWSNVESRLTLSNETLFTKEKVNSNKDLYIKSKDAKYDFTTAIFSAGGTVSSVNTGSEIITGVAYDLNDVALAAGWGAQRYIFTGQHTGRVETPKDKDFEYIELQAEKIVSAANGGAILVNVDSKASIENSYFSGNISSTSGGAVYNYLRGKVTIHNTTFTGNSAGTGGAVCNRRDLVIGNVVFDGNVATAVNGGGAIYSLINGTQGGSVTIDGKITLMTATDTIYSPDAATWTINASAFGDGPYYQIIDAVSSSNWSGVANRITVSDANLFSVEKVNSNKDLYIKSKNAKYNFANAVLSADGTVSSAVIAGETVSGVAYLFDDSSLASAFGAQRYVFVNPELTGQVTIPAGMEYDYTGARAVGVVSAASGGIFDISSGRTLKLEGGTLAGNISTGSLGAVIYNRAGASATLSGTTFTGNRATANNACGGVVSNYGSLTVANAVFAGNYATFGGAVHATAATVITGGTFTDNTGRDGGAVYASGDLTVSGTTFAGNSISRDGGAIYAGGKLTIGNILFSGNSASRYGGALYTADAVTVNGKITLLKTTDTIVAGSTSTWAVDAASFGGGQYYQVISSASASAWNSIADRITVSGSGYTLDRVNDNKDLYLKKDGVNFTNAILTAGGTSSSVEIAGENFTGAAYDFSDLAIAKNLGAANLIYDGYTVTSTDKAPICSGAAGDTVIAFKNSSFAGGLYGFDSTGQVDGDLTLLLENTAVDAAVYAGGDAAVNGDITIKIAGSTIGSNVSTTSSTRDQHHRLVTIDVSNSVIGGTLRGTGSDSHPAVDDVVITVADSLVNEIIAGYGNPVGGNAAITLSGATVSTAARRFGKGKTDTIAGAVSLTVTGNKVTEVGGDILGMDTLTVDAGAELRLTGGSVVQPGKLLNNGTLTVTTDHQLMLIDGARPGTINVDNCTLTVNVNRVNTGLSYEDVNLLNGGMLTVTGTGFGIGNRIYNYCVVDSTLTGETGDVVTVTVDGVDTQAIFGVNAFTSSEAAAAAHAGTQLIVVKENIAGNYYGNGALKISGGSIGGNLYGQGETIITGGTVGKVAYGGRLMKTSGDAGSSALTITGSTFAKLVVGGSRVSVNGTDAAVTGGTAALNVSGGTFASHLVAAGYVINDGTVGTASLNMGEADLTLANITTDKYAVGGAFVNNGSATVDTVNVAVESGTYKSVFGGGWAQKGTSSVGTANLTVSGGSIHNLYAGGTDNGEDNAATVETANITISGGSVRNIFLNGKYSRDTVNTATLNITGACEINWIEGLCHSMVASSASAKTAVNIGANLTVEDILHVDEWNFNTVGTLLDFGTHTADLDGTTEAAVNTVIDFQIGKQDIGEGWTAVAAQKFEGLKQSSVEINGQAASAYVAETNTWTFDTDYTVTLSQYNDTRKALIVTKTA